MYGRNKGRLHLEEDELLEELLEELEELEDELLLLLDDELMKIENCEREGMQEGWAQGFRLWQSGICGASQAQNLPRRCTR
jgi:hypothetical protein